VLQSSANLVFSTTQAIPAAAVILPVKAKFFTENNTFSEPVFFFEVGFEKFNSDFPAGHPSYGVQHLSAFPGTYAHDGGVQGNLPFFGQESRLVQSPGITDTATAAFFWLVFKFLSQPEPVFQVIRAFNEFKIQMAGYPFNFLEPQFVFFWRLDVRVVEKSSHLVIFLQQTYHIKGIRRTTDMSQDFWLLVHTDIVIFNRETVKTAVIF